jgi:amino acid adenylation domain-containing protein
MLDRSQATLLPAALSQERLWVLEQVAGRQPLHNITWAARLRGPVDADRLRSAFAAVIARHEALRTALHQAPEGLVQLVWPEVPLPWREVRARENELQALVDAEAATPFDTGEPPLVRALLAHVDGGAALAVTMHHAVSDGRSFALFLRELGEAYAGRAARLPEPELHFGDFAAWQREMLEGPRWRELSEFWANRLSAPLARLDLPADRPAPARPTYRGGLLRFALPQATVARLRAFCGSAGCTPYLALLTAFATWCCRLTGQRDVVLGTNTLGRPRPELEDVIGFFANTLVVRTRVPAGTTYRALVKTAGDDWLGALAHEDMPFDRLVQLLRPERDGARHPFFDVLFTYQKVDGSPLVLPGVAVEPIRAEGTTAKFALTIGFQDEGDRLGGFVEYSHDRYDAATVARHLASFQALLADALARPDVPVEELTLVDDEERRLVLEGFNDTARDTGPPPLLHAGFFAQAARTPDAPAVRDAREVLSYGEARRRALRLAGELRSRGVGPDSLVGLCVDRTADLPWAVLGILAAGGAYVPLDPSLPALRLEAIASESALTLAVTSAANAERVRQLGLAAVDVADAAAPGPAPELNPSEGLSPTNLAYVLFTSGSTGKPKGVQVGHGAPAYIMERWGEWLRLTPDDVVCAVAPIAFDISTLDLFVTLNAGAQVFVCASEETRNGARLRARLESLRPTALQTTPAVWSMLQEAGWVGHGRLSAISGGEALTPDLVRWLRPLADRLLNAYGPTEAGVYSSVEEIEGPELITIGRPVVNVRHYVLNDQLQPVPVGVPGELYIAGAGLARGYLSRPDLTAERFLPDPYVPAGEPGGRMYRTGDLARFLPDGRIVYLGRKDEQVKIRGSRLELGEVESVLRSAPGVELGAVLVVGQSHEERELVAVMVPADGVAPEPDAVRRHLKERLPDYMVPARYHTVSSLPLTPSGKLDRKALAAVIAAAPAGPRPAARPAETPGQAEVARICRELLGWPVDDLDRTFFEVGGHSLSAIRLVNRIRELHQVEVPLDEVFRAPSLRALAERLDEAREAAPAATIPLVRGPAGGPRPLSFAQSRLLLLDLLLPDQSAYVIPLALRLQGPLDEAALEEALGTIVRRHAVLRSRFRLNDREAVQEVVDEALVVERHAEPGVAPAERPGRLVRLGAEDARRPFALAREPPLRATIVSFAPDDHGLLICFHHVAADGGSLAIFLRELEALYGAQALPPLAVDYADFAAWQRERAAAPEFQAHLAYWREELADLPEPMALPSAQARPARLSSVGGTLEFALGADLTEQLDGLVRQRGATTFVGLLALFEAWLFRWTGSNDIVVGTPAGYRGATALEPLIGLFVNSVPLRVRTGAGDSLTALLDKARAAAAGAFAHQDVPFETIVEQSGEARDAARNPLFQVLFSYLEERLQAPRLAGLQTELLEVPLDTAKLDLALTFRRGPAGLVGTFEYCTIMFTAEAVRSFADGLTELARGLLSAPAAPLAAVPVCSPRGHPAFGARANYPTGLSVSDLFDRCVRERPDHEFVVAGRQRWTYRQVQERADQIAAALAGRGIAEEDLVAVMLGKEADLIASLFGVLQAGAAYVPVSPDYPPERIARMLTVAAPRVILTTGAERGKVPVGLGASVVLLEELKAGGRPPRRSSPRREQLAYAIFTSGTTGVPKAVMVSHGALVNAAFAWRQEFALRPDERVLQLASFSFDVFGGDLLRALVCGGTLVLCPDEVRLDLPALHELMVRERITILESTPGLLLPLLDHARQRGLGFPSLRTWIFGSDLLKTDDAVRAAEFLGPGVRVINSYGITETAIDSSYMAREHPAFASRNASGCVPIGVAFPNSNLYVLSDDLALLPPGVVGELYIGGPGVARGYLGRPDLTAERFVPDPFVPGARMYRAGDRGRWRADGALEMFGREDHQLKVRGVRVEAGEVEAAVLAVRGARKCVVVAVPVGQRERALAAYVVAEGGLDEEALRRELEARLPAAVVPEYVVFLTDLPLTPNGKVDRKALPRPTFAARAPAAELNETERAVHEVWAEVLGGGTVPPDAGFFTVGGNSLLMLQLFNGLNRRFSVQLTLADLFANHTIRMQARHLEALTAPAGSGDDLDALLDQLEAGTIDVGAALGRLERR